MLNFVYVFFHPPQTKIQRKITDENDCEICEEVLRELERIDDEADDLEVMFVKIRDTRYAKKYGITAIPTLVFFRKKFPSVYRGE